MTDQNIALGSKAEDIVSGWEGTVVARYEYLNGCIRYSIAGRDKDGKPDEYVFDAQQVRVTVPPNAALLPTPEPTPEPAPPVRSVGGPRDNRPVAR